MKKTVYLSEWFRETFSNMGKDNGVLQKELEGAKKDYPKLILSYQLLGTYARYLERSHTAISRIVNLSQPIPDLGTGGPFPFPPVIEGRDIFEELKEFVEAEVQIGAEWEAENRDEIRACPIIRQDYNRASECVQRFLDQPPETEVDWDEFQNCISDLQLFASEMETKGCT